MSSPDSNNASIQSHGSAVYGSIRRGSNDYSNGQHHTSTGATGYRHHTNDPTSPAYPAMPFSRRLTYGVGHVLNDLCSSMWFSYLLIYLTKIIMFTNRQAGNLIMIGQVCDGLATPFIGHESDSMEKGCFSYGRRKSWHLLGNMLPLLNTVVMYNFNDNVMISKIYCLYKYPCFSMFKILVYIKKLHVTIVNTNRLPISFCCIQI